jgi:hypothetical protein
MQIATVTGSLLLALASAAAAQPGMTSQDPAPAPEPPPPPTGEPLREDIALTIATGSTFASWALMVGPFYLADDNGNFGELGLASFLVGSLGTLIAPSFGHWYAGTYLTRGMGLRVAGAASVVAAFAVAVEEGLLSSEPHAADRTSIPPALAIIGATLLLAGTVDDLITTPRRVRQRNRARGFAIAPLVSDRSAGLALGGRF